MPKIQLKGLDDTVFVLNRLTDKSEGVIKRAIYDGAGNLYAADDGVAIVTYCINPTDQKRLITDDTTYRPRVRSFCLR